MVDDRLECDKPHRIINNWWGLSFFGYVVVVSLSVNLVIVQGGRMSLISTTFTAACKKYRGSVQDGAALTGCF